MSRVALQRHVQVEHFGVKDYKHKCEQCPAQYFDSTQLRDHIATKHEGRRPYACRLCSQTFVCRPTLNRHIRRDHEGEHNLYVCKVCGEKFTEKHFLARHQVVHTGVDPLTCHFCNKSFTRKNTFDRHMDCHKGIRPFLCEDCGMSYACQKYLIRHKQSPCNTKRKNAFRYKVQLIESFKG